MSCPIFHKKIRVEKIAPIPLWGNFKGIAIDVWLPIEYKDILGVGWFYRIQRRYANSIGLTVIGFSGRGLACLKRLEG